MSRQLKFQIQPFVPSSELTYIYILYFKPKSNKIKKNSKEKKKEWEEGIGEREK